MAEASEGGHLAKAFGDKGLDDISTEDVQRLKAAGTEGPKAHLASATRLDESTRDREFAPQWERDHAIQTFIQRLIGAAMLDGRTYEEVEADRTATGQAGLVVLLSSLAAGFGSVGAGIFDVRGIVVGTLGGLAGWVSWAALTYLIGTRVLPEPQTRANLGELLRTLAFAATPGLLRVVGAIPILRWPAFLVTALWMLLAMVIAVRHALDYRSTARALGVCVLGWAFSLAVAAAIGILFATPVS